MTVAFSKSVEVRRNKARINSNNRLFYGALSNYERAHGIITANTDLKDFMGELKQTWNEDGYRNGNNAQSLQTYD